MKKLLKLVFISLFLLLTSTPINLLHAETLTTQDRSVEVESNDQNTETKSSKVVNQTPTQTTARAITGLTAKSKWNTSFFLEGANILEATKIPANATDDVTWKAITPYTNVSFKNPNSLITNVNINIPGGMNELNTKYTVPGYEYNFEVSSKNDPTVKATTSLVFGGLRAQVTELGKENFIYPDQDAFANFLEYLKQFSNPSVSYKWKTYKYNDRIFWTEQLNSEAERQGYSGIEGKIDLNNPQLPELKVSPTSADQGNRSPQNTRVKIEFSISHNGSIFNTNVSSNLALVKVSSDYPQLISVPNFNYQVGVLEYNQIDQPLLLTNLLQKDERERLSPPNNLTLRNESDYKFEVKSKMTVFDSHENQQPITSNMEIVFNHGAYPNLKPIIVGSSEYQHIFCQDCLDDHNITPIDHEWIFDMRGDNAMLHIKENRAPLPNTIDLKYKAVLDWIITIADPSKIESL